MKIRVTYVTGEAPNLPWSRVSRMTDDEIRAYNEIFYRRETVEFDDGRDASAPSNGERENG